MGLGYVVTKEDKEYFYHKLDDGEVNFITLEEWYKINGRNAVYERKTRLIIKLPPGRTPQGYIMCLPMEYDLDLLPTDIPYRI